MDIIMDTCSREGPFQIFNRFPDLFFTNSIQFIWRGDDLARQIIITCESQLRNFF